MTKIGSWWLKGVEAEPDEAVVWSQGANRIQPSGRAVGGKLFLTDRRLVFCPHWVDGATGGKTWDVRLTDVAVVGTAPKGGKRGGLRDRLRIELKDGEDQLFVVNRLADVVPRLEAGRQEGGQASTDGTTTTQ
jgi:hypothetical protein